MINPLVTIIIPAYNYAHFLGETLESVLNQTYSNWECLIIDDGSIDNTREIGLKYCKKDARVKYFYKTNGGLSSARNEGLKNANGDYIQLLDADDIIKPEKIKKQIQIFDKDSRIDICYTNFDFLDGDSDKILEKEKKWRVDIKGDIYEDFLFNWINGGLIIPSHCFLISNKFLKEKNINFDERVKAIEDWLFWLEIAKRGASFYFIDESLVLYRRHSASMVQDHKKMMYNYILAVFYTYDNLDANYKKNFVQSIFDSLYSSYEGQIQKVNDLENSLIYKTGKLIIAPLVKLKNLLKRLRFF